MCKRPSRSLNNTVTALMRFSSVKYLRRSSCTFCGATRSRRCFLAFRFSSSSSSYGSAKKLRSSFDISLLKVSCKEFRWADYRRKMAGHETVRVSRCVSKRQIEKLATSSRKTNPNNHYFKSVVRAPPLVQFLSRVANHWARAPSRGRSVVILLPQVRDQVLAHHPAQRVLQFHQLNEQIMLGIQVRRGHRRLEIETQPLLNPAHPRALRQIQEQNQIEHDGRRQNRVAAQEIHLDLHGIAEPSEDVDVVPAFFVVPARRIIIDAHFVVHLAVQHRVELWLQNVFQGAQLRFFLGLE